MGEVIVPPFVKSVLSELLEAGQTRRDRLYFVHESAIAGLNSFKQFADLDPDEKRTLVKSIAKLVWQPRSGHVYEWGHKDFGYAASTSILTGLLRALIGAKLQLDVADIAELLEFTLEQANEQQDEMTLADSPLNPLVSHLASLAKQTPLSPSELARLDAIAANKQFLDWDVGEVAQAHKKLQSLLIRSSTDSNAVPPYRRLSGDTFGEHVLSLLAAMSEMDRSQWHRLLHHCATANGSKPSKQYHQQAEGIIDQIGVKAYKEAIHDWLSIATKSAVTFEHHRADPGPFTDSNKQLLKGLVWTLVRFHDEKTLQTIADLAASAARKIPGVGPAAQSVVNACLYVLANSRGINGIAHLSRLKLSIKQANTQKRIQHYIDENAAKMGIKPAQIEEIAAPEFGLEDGERVWIFGDDYRLRLTVSGPGKADITWHKPDGKLQKSVPAFVKASKTLSDTLKSAKAIQKQVKTASTVQRDRIDRLYVEDMTWSYEDFCKYYRDHGLVSTIARKLIWRLQTGSSQTSAIYHDGVWQDSAGNVVATSGDTVVRMWHPIDDEIERILAWRDQLEALGITQPLKQAYREIYILTEAELSTATYSNRMAAHILKQHQFNTLAAIRGWQYSLLGAYDDGRNGDIARKKLPAHGMRAEYWIDEILDNQDHFNDAGIWLYVATDQVRLVNTAGDSEQALPLVDIPKIVLSEVMRDVDLFVGVASVGNDPNWIDNGGAPRQHDDYWHTYSFGELTELAKTRKIVLERLLPKLKIRDAAHIDGKFLMVDGKRHTYKIHIGSGNILIAPADRYLCIVPGRGVDKTTDRLFLPFEGDRGLSIVLSKAFMLAEDDKITDETILSQL